MDRKEIVDELYDVISQAEDLMYKIKSEQIDLDEPTENLRDWKKLVIEHLPKKCSLAFRLKVEELLDGLNED